MLQVLSALLVYKRTVASPIYKKALRALSSAFERLHFKSLVLVKRSRKRSRKRSLKSRKRSESPLKALRKRSI